MLSLFSKAYTPVCWCHEAVHSDIESVHYQFKYTADQVQLNVARVCFLHFLYSSASGSKLWGNKFGLNSLPVHPRAFSFFPLSHVIALHSFFSLSPDLLIFSHPQRREVSLYLCGDCWQQVQSPWDAKLAMPAVRSIHAGWPRPHCPARLCQAAGSCWLTSLLFLLHIGTNTTPMQPHLGIVAMLWAHHTGTGLAYSEQGSCVLFAISQCHSKVHPGITFSLLFLNNWH